MRVIVTCHSSYCKKSSKIPTVTELLNNLFSQFPVRNASACKEAPRRVTLHNDFKCSQVTAAKLG